MNLSRDFRHEYNLLMGLSNKESNFNRFQSGNLRSLKREGIRDDLLKFHSKWYSSNVMSLCIIGKHSMEEMEKWVKSMFGPVENKNVVVPDMS